MTRETKCHIIIHSAAAAASIPVILGNIFPFSDSLLVVPIQLTMAALLIKTFKIHNKTKRKNVMISSLLLPFLAAFAGRYISQKIPIAGLSSAITAAGLTELIGWQIVKDCKRKSRPGNRTSYEDLIL